MTEAIISAAGAVLVGLLSLLGVVVTNRRAGAQMLSELKTAQAVTDERLSELAREVRLHNDFARRVPVIEEQIKVINHRITDLKGCETWSVS